VFELDERNILRKPEPATREERRVYRSSFTVRTARIFFFHVTLCSALICAGSLLRVDERSLGHWFYLAGLLYLVLIFLVLYDELEKKIEVRRDGMVLYRGARRHDLDWVGIRNFATNMGRFPWGRGALVEGKSRMGIPVRFFFHKSTFRDYDQVVSLIRVGMNDSWRNYLKKMNIKHSDVRIERAHESIVIE
jgi:hypothetical protein